MPRTCSGMKGTADTLRLAKSFAGMLVALGLPVLGRGWGDCCLGEGRGAKRAKAGGVPG